MQSPVVHTNAVRDLSVRGHCSYANFSFMILIFKNSPFCAPGDLDIESRLPVSVKGVTICLALHNGMWRPDSGNSMSFKILSLQVYICHHLASQTPNCPPAWHFCGLKFQVFSHPKCLLFRKLCDTPNVGTDLKAKARWRHRPQCGWIYCQLSPKAALLVVPDKKSRPCNAIWQRKEPLLNVIC